MVLSLAQEIPEVRRPGEHLMEKIVILIDNLLPQTYQGILDEITENGDTPVVHSISRSFFPVTYNDMFARYLSDLEKVLASNGYCISKDEMDIFDENGIVDAYELLAKQIQAFYPQIDFSKIDRVVYSRDDTSWADVQFCMTFFGHAQWDLYVESA